MKFNVDDLVEQGLVKKKTYTDGLYKGLSVLKYSRKVFFNNLWNIDERLLECRGIVVDEEDNIIVRPFTKTFNLYENNTLVDRDKEVLIPIKINGFLGVATLTDKYGLIISTTGTLDSEYASLARKHIEQGSCEFEEGLSYMFEICDETDPHVVEEKHGAHLIGIRVIETGELLSETTCGIAANVMGYERPCTEVKRFSDVLQELKTCKHEGFIVRDAENGEVLCKLKSPHYLSKKALQRCGKNKAAKMWNNPTLFKKQLDEEFYDIFDKILDTFTQEEYLSMQEQERRKWIEGYFVSN